MISNNYTEVDATIWLLKGDHFFFYCDQLWQNQTKTTVVGQKNETLNLEKLCKHESMISIHPKTDNVNLAIKTYNCEAAEAKNTVEARYDLSWFYNKCSKVKTDPTSRAVIHVNSNEFMFNITKMALF